MHSILASDYKNPRVASRLFLKFLPTIAAHLSRSLPYPQVLVEEALMVNCVDLVGRGLPTRKSVLHLLSRSFPARQTAPSWARITCGDPCPPVLCNRWSRLCVTASIGPDVRPCVRRLKRPAKLGAALPDVETGSHLASDTLGRHSRDFVQRGDLLQRLSSRNPAPYF